MKKILFSVIAIVLFFPCLVQAQEKQRIYLIDINYDRGRLTFGEVSTKLGYAPAQKSEKQMGEIPYWVRVISFKGELLEEKKFSITPVISYSPPVEGEEYDGPSGEVRLDQMETMAIINHYDNGKWLELRDANRRMIERKDIGYLAQVCGDGECQDHESYEDCKQDCSAMGKDGFCNTEKKDEDPDCVGVVLEKTGENKIIDETKIVDTTKKNMTKYIALGIVIMLIPLFSALAYYFLVKKKKDEEINNQIK